jgi:tetratricopeptide (TPR) repeat protein
MNLKIRLLGFLTAVFLVVTLPVRADELDRCFDLLDAQDYARAQALAESLTRSQPNRGTFLCLGRALKAQGQFRAALSAFQEAEKRSRSQEELAVIYNWLGSTYKDLGDLDNALYYTQRSLGLSRALKNRKGEARNLNNLASIMQDKGELDQALRYYEESLRLRDTDAEKATTWNNIGGIYYQRGDFARAAEYRERAVAAERRAGNYHEMGCHLINLANDYRALERFEAAQRALDEGLAIVRKVGDRDWEAGGVRIQAQLLRDQGKRQLAGEQFEAAARLYDVLGQAGVAQAVRAELKAMMEAGLVERVYAGIEIGAKGVKALAMRLRFNDTGFYDAQTLFRRSLNPTAIAGIRATGALTPEAIEETAQAVKTLVDEMRARNHAPLVIAASSAFEEVANRDELASRIASLVPELPPLNANLGKAVLFIDAREETLFGILGAIPPAFQEKGLLVDVGSGNTKIGYVATDAVKNTPEVQSFALPFGTVTLTEAAAADKAFGSAAQAALRRTALPQLKAEVARRPAYANRKPVVLVGGAVWAAATMLHPEQARQSFVELRLKEIAQLRERLEKNPKAPLAPPLDAIADAEDRAAAEKELGAVRDTFSRENLMAGLVLLESIGQTLGWKDKPLYFARHGTWLDGLIQVLGVAIEENAPAQPAKTGRAPANDPAWQQAA